jgi:hypothetical protein
MPGEYVVQASTSRRGPSTEGAFGLQFVTIQDADVRGVVVRLSAGSTITGRVTFEGGPPADATDVDLTVVPSEADGASLADNPSNVTQ